MTNKFPDTIASWQNTTMVDVPSGNIFSPHVRVQLSWSDIEDAVERGAIVPSEAHALWALWASSDSPQRVATGPAPAASQPEEPKAKSLNSLFGRFA